MTTVQGNTFLGIEGGGTRTSVLLVNQSDEVLAEFTAGPANLRLMHGDELESHLSRIRDRLPATPTGIGIGLAGARSDADKKHLRAAVGRVWPDVPCHPTDDLLLALEATAWLKDCPVQVLVLSGTGSCSVGRRRSGETVKVGGRGHILGDRASSCDIAQHALRAVMTISDIDNEWPRLGADILAHLQMNDPEDLIEWSLEAPKTELAGLAVCVFRAAVDRDDDIAVAVLDRAAQRLAKDAIHCAERVARPDERVQFLFNGAVLLKNPAFATDVARRLREGRENSVVTPLDRPSVWGAISLARKLCGENSHPPPQAKPDAAPAQPHWRPVGAAPTEQRNPRSTRLSEMPVAEAIALMLEEDASLPAAILQESTAIEWTIDRVTRAFAEGGRLLYTGAGTSGRLGVLDASECPPTFRTPPDLVQGIIAGGRRALWRAVEGAEDDPAAGRSAMCHRGVTDRDVVIGITASGHAPFVWGCLEEAKSRGATTVLLCCNPAYRDHPLPDQAILPDTGPEVLTGSTRLKAGTATKLILNLISTLSLTHSGKVLGNLMVDLNPSNHKLRDRAVRIVGELAGVDEDAARRALKASAWVVRDACAALARD